MAQMICPSGNGAQGELSALRNPSPSFEPKRHCRT
jgi:hypothetical protein